MRCILILFLLSLTVACGADEYKNRYIIVMQLLPQGFEMPVLLDTQTGKFWISQQTGQGRVFEEFNLPEQRKPIEYNRGMSGFKTE
jgi:hypothetical protein